MPYGRNIDIPSLRAGFFGGGGNIMAKSWQNTAES